MLRKKIFLLFLIFICSLSIGAKNNFHYYDIKNVISIKGKIVDFKVEKVYKKRSEFFFIYLKDKNNKAYKIEVCPNWFFSFDMAKDMNIIVKGSKIDEGKTYKYIIAKEIEFGGNKIILRDKMGFPLWRGKKQNQTGGQKRNRRGRGGIK